MDPLTAGLNLANSLVQAWLEIWKATPPEGKAAIAGDIAKGLHNVGEFLQTVQGKINVAVKA